MKLLSVFVKYCRLNMSTYVCECMLNVHLLKNDFIMKLHKKNDFAEVSKNLTRYRSENNF